VFARWPEQDSVLECIAKNEFSSSRIDHRPRKHWDELRGLGHLRHYALDAAALEKDVEEKARRLIISAFTRTRF